jgi:HPt (histidine-containing phosphotransfer) domain-containing protein
MAHPVKSFVSVEASIHQEAVGENKPVDLVHLSKMTMADRSLEKEVLALFRNQSVLCLNRLETAECDESFTEAAHAVKGSARGIGAWQVAEYADVIEQSGRASNQAQRDQLKQAVADANRYITQLLVD